MSQSVVNSQRISQTDKKWPDKTSITSPIPGEVEQIVHIPYGIVPSTTVAVQIHSELKKSGILSKSKNAMVYLMSANSSIDNMPVSPVVKPTLTNSKKMHSNKAQQQKTVDQREEEDHKTQKPHVNLGSALSPCSTSDQSSGCATVSSNVTTHKSLTITSQTEETQKSTDRSTGVGESVPDITKQNSAMARIGTLTLPVVAPHGLTLSVSSRYVPILCQIESNSKKRGIHTTSNHPLPVYVLQNPPSDSKAVKIPDNAVASGNINNFNTSTIGEEAKSDHISVQKHSFGNGEIGSENTQSPVDLTGKGTFKSVTWKIINGSLIKTDSKNEFSVSSFSKRALVRLPLGTGQRPSLVTEDGAIHMMKGQHDRYGKESMLSDVIPKLKVLVGKKAKDGTMSVKTKKKNSVKQKSSVELSLSDNGDKGFIPAFVRNNVTLFSEMPEFHQRRIAYAHGIEGLNYAPSLLISNLEDPVSSAEITCSLVSCDNEDSGDNFDESEKMVTDVGCLSASLFTMKGSAQMTLHDAPKDVCQTENSSNLQTKTDDLFEKESSSNDAVAMEPATTSTDGNIGVEIISEGDKHLLSDTCNQSSLTEVTSLNSSAESWSDQNDLNLDETKFGPEPQVDILDGIVFVDGTEIEMPTPVESVEGFCCYLCGFSALKQEHVVEHWLKTHISEKPYLCAVCRSAAFSSSWLLMKHIKCYHSSFQNCMPMMLKPSQVFENTLIMLVGKDKNISNKRLDSLWKDIEETPEGYDSEDNCEQTSANSLQIYCNNCSFSTVSVLKMRTHLTNVHPKPYSFNCSDCHKLFLCRFDLARHRQIVHQLNDISGECSSVFAQHKVSVRLNGAHLHWHKVCQTRCDSNSPSDPLLECLICKSKGLHTHLATARAMWLHLQCVHKWPSQLECSTCGSKVRILDIERRQKKSYCHTCSNIISLQPIINENCNLDAPVYICKACNYKTMERSTIFRHVKYSYAQFRPYGCPYCKYSAVEKAKVKKHVLNSHSDVRHMVKVNFDAICAMKRTIDALMKKMTMKVRYRDLDLLLGQDESLFSWGWNQKYWPVKNFTLPTKTCDDSSEESTYVNEKNAPKTVLYQCKDCPYRATSLLTFRRHRRRTHCDLNAPVYVSDSQKKKFLKSSQIIGQHYQCNICHYCCLDRSSMTRHIKYMHMRERPHSCPYCKYKNVEKTKVRIHVLSTHAGSPVYVNSDTKLLKMMSRKVKGNYRKIINNQEKTFQHQKRKVRQPGKGSDVPLRCYRVIEKPDAQPEPEVFPQLLVVNAHNRAASDIIATVPLISDGGNSSGGIQGHSPSVDENKADKCLLPVSIKSEPDADDEIIKNKVDDSLIAVQVKEENALIDIDIKPELQLHEEMNPTLESFQTEQSKYSSDSEQEPKPITEQLKNETDDDDDSIVDVAWMVETIDTDTDEEMEVEEARTEDTFMDYQNVNNFSEGCERRKRSLDDEWQGKEKIMKIMDMDKKLRMKPVVLVRDVIQQILCGELT